jgi:hypothetical protein
VSRRGPPKAFYLEFEDNADTEFSFVLAEKLGKTVAEIDDMSAAEFVRWNVYLGRKAQMEQLAQKGG